MVKKCMCYFFGNFISKFSLTSTDNDMKKRIALAFAFVIVFASASLVAADQAGIINITLFNSPQAQLHTEIANSTITAHTNYTNSQAVENITLINSTLTININGQRITITDQNSNITIQTPKPTSILPPTTTPTQTQIITPNPGNNATPAPTQTATGLVGVTFIGSGPNHSPIGNGTQYDFNVTVGMPTSFNYPFGKNVSHATLEQALIPLAARYNLVSSNSSGLISATWQNMVVVSGENTFSVWSLKPLTGDQISGLTVDLRNMFTSIV